MASQIYLGRNMLAVLGIDVVLPTYMITITSNKVGRAEIQKKTSYSVSNKILKKKIRLE